MKKLFKKKFIYLVLMLFVLAGINTGSVWADESVDYEEGVSNLNNTPENSAKVGDTLLKPEIGWKRYDNTHRDIKYNGSWQTGSDPVYYNRTKSQSNVTDSTIKFRFTGTKIRVISTLNNIWYNADISITIDGKESIFNQSSTKRIDQVVVFEKNGLSDEVHTVELRLMNKEKFILLDAIDVDGKLLNENEVPNVESITLDKNELELLEGSQDKLTATVLPENASNKKVVWSSSDESIATVNQEGNITAIKEGEAIITAKVEGTDLTATCKVIVKAQEQGNSNAILSITMVNGITKEYDVNSKVLNDYLSWFESASGTSTFKFSKTISPYKKVTEYLVHDKIASFEVREY